MTRLRNFAGALLGLFLVLTSAVAAPAVQAQTLSSYINTATPTARTPACNRWVAMGDSRPDNGRLSDASNASFKMRGLLTWVRFLSGQRIVHNIEDIYAVSGYTSTQVTQNLLPLAAASPACAVVVLNGTNDRPGAGLSYQTTIDNYVIQRNTLLAAGKVVVFIAEMPRGDASNTGNRLTGAQIAIQQRIRLWLLSQASIPGVYVIDPWPVMADPASTTGDDLAAMFADGLHPNQYGSFYGVAQPLTALVNQLHPPINILPASNTDVYDATNNPGGVLTANPGTVGTGGTITAPGAGSLTGTAANSYTLSLSTGTGLTVVASKVTTADGKQWQQIVVSGTPTGNAEVRMTLPTVTSGITAANDNMDAFAEWQVDAGQTGLNRVYLSVFDGAASRNRNDMDRVAVNDNMPTAAMNGVARVPAWTVATTGSLIPSVGVSFLAGVPASATVRVRAIGVRKAVAP